jgi:GNAT superfamily N-acetyltransferase
MNLLLTELVRARRLAETPVLRPILEKVGLTGWPRGWGVDWVEVDGDLYRPADEGGRVALIVGAYQLGGLIDLVATSLETRAMRRRKGLGTLLGEDRIDHALEHGTSLPVFSDGIAWIANERRGIVVLDWSDAYEQIADVPSLTCETEALAVRIRRTFAGELCSVPPLFVPDVQSKERSHAA